MRTAGEALKGSVGVIKCFVKGVLVIVGGVVIGALTLFAVALVFSAVLVGMYNAYAWWKGW